MTNDFAFDSKNLTRSMTIPTNNTNILFEDLKFYTLKYDFFYSKR